MQCTKLQLFDIKQNDRTFKLLQFFTTNLLVLLHENCKIVNTCMYIEISRYVYRLIASPIYKTTRTCKVHVTHSPTEPF